MRRILPSCTEPLFGAQATRQIEQAAAAPLPPHALMARAGLATARLAQAIAPHARCIWVACGPGNNGGDGLVAATHLHMLTTDNAAAPQILVTLCADPTRMPPDAAQALSEARTAGVTFMGEPPAHFDLAIDALLGIGPLRPPDGALAEVLSRLQDSAAPVLCVDLPSGLDPDTGRHMLGPRRRALAAPRHTLSLLTLKPGLFTHDGRDQAGCVWFDDLGIATHHAPDALLHGVPLETATVPPVHAGHKGLRGDVVVLGGQDMAIDGSGMTGAAILAARAALLAGAGRVYVGLLGSDDAHNATTWDPVCPELMFRDWHRLPDSRLMEEATVICGCGGGQAVRTVLPAVLNKAHSLVLDADGLNAVAADSALQKVLQGRAQRNLTTVLTPHPLEAARLLGCSTGDVMADRLSAARALCERFQAICVIKGSGTVTCAPGETPRINASGNGALATAGTGDVLAGMIGAAMAGMQPDQAPAPRVADTVFRHGWLADRWLTKVGGDVGASLTASDLAFQLS